MFHALQAKLSPYSPIQIKVANGKYPFRPTLSTLIQTHEIIPPLHFLPPLPQPPADSSYQENVKHMHVFIPLVHHFPRRLFHRPSKVQAQSDTVHVSSQPNERTRQFSSPTFFSAGGLYILTICCLPSTLVSL